MAKLTSLEYAVASNDKIMHGGEVMKLREANGTVYSWGGGMDGQLGHGEDVMYLSEPKALCSHGLPGRVSQVVCGDSYSAALLADGSLYMWGKNSHVIQSDQPSSKKLFHPVSIPLNGHSVSMVTCGSWHTAAITGKPARQPLDEDSDISEDDDDELDDFIKMETSDDEDAFQGGDVKFWDMSNETSAPQNNTELSSATVNPPALDPNRHPYRLAREGTTLTLEEFYSATPTPCIRPRELHRPSLTERKRAAQEDVAQSTNMEMNFGVMDKNIDKMVDDRMVDESSVDEGSTIISQVVDSAEEAVPNEPKEPVPKTNLEGAMPKTTIQRLKKGSATPQTDMQRSKTMGSIPKKSIPKGTLPRVYDMSAMSGAGDADKGFQSKFVVDKHVAIQARKDSPSSSWSASSPSSSASSSSSSRRNQSGTKQAVATVSLVCTDNAELPPPKEKVPNSLPIPKMTRAQTLYGPMRTHGKIRTSQTDSPPIVHPSAPIVSMAYKTRHSIIRETSSPAGKSKYGTKSGSSTLSELKHHAASGAMHGTVGQSKSVRRPLGAMSSSSQRKPVFSSAGSWRNRSGVDDALLVERRTPPDSAQQGKISTKEL